MPQDKRHRYGDDLDLGRTAPLPASGSPGKSTLTGKLFRRPIINVHRSAERDDRGVASGAEEQVERAAGSSGVALPADLRERFESSLGADLSGVRLHTDATSETAAGAVGAKAYTVGNDIHFGAGQYDPSSSDGLFLIAHEVAHTVQQAGATPVRQHKLEVSSTGDAVEAEADAAAAAMISGRAATVTGQPAIAPGILRKPNDSIYDELDEAPNPYAPPAEVEAGANPPTAAQRDQARAYYESLRSQNLQQIQRIDAELAGIPAHAPEKSSIFGREVDAKTRDDRKAMLEAMKKDYEVGNETIAGNLALVDDPRPESQAKGVNRANASKAVYTSSEPMRAVQVLLTGSGKSSHTITEEQKTASGVGQTTITKTTGGVSLKDGTIESGTSKSVTNEENGKKSTVSSSEKTTIGRGGVTTTQEHAEISDGKLNKVSATDKVTLGDGRVGTEKTIAASSGSESDGELKRGVTVSGTATKGVTATNDAISADAGIKGTATGQNNAQQSVSVTPALDGKATLSITRDAKGKYLATITLALSVSVGVKGTAGHESLNKTTTSGSLNGDLRKSDTRVIRVPLDQADVEGYEREFQAAAGGAATSKPGLHYVALLKTKGDDAVLAALGGSDGSEHAREQGLGYERSKGEGYSVGGGGSVAPSTTSPTSSSVGATVNYSKNRKITYGHDPKPGDPETLVVTIMVSTDSALTGGPTVSSGGASGAVTYTKKDAGGKHYKFEMANDATLVAKLDALETEEDAKSFVAAHSKAVLETGDRKGSGDGIGATVGAGPVSAGMTWGGESGETVIKDANGNVVATDVYGRNTVDGSAKAGPISLGTRQDVDELAGRVNADGTADLNLEKRTTTSEMSATELGKNAKERPILTSYQLLTGSSAPYMKNTTDVAATTKLTEKDLESIQKAAESDDDSRWTKACWDGKAMDDWFATREKIRQAKGDKTKIAKALADFEDSWDSGRSDTIKGLGVGRYHAAWPPELASHRARFEQLASDKLSAQVVATYRTEGLDAALAQIETLRADISGMLDVIRDNTDKLKDTAVSEMNKVLGKRSSELTYLKHELPKQKRAAEQNAHDALVETQLAHGVDTKNCQTNHVPEVLKPQESVPDEVLYATPTAPAPEPVLSPEEEAKQKRAAAFEAIAHDRKICSSNRKKEHEELTWAEGELTKKGNFLAKPDYGAIFARLNAVKSGWSSWDEAVTRIRTALAASGVEATGVDDLGPRRAWWNQINDEATSHHG